LEELIEINEETERRVEKANVEKEKIKLYVEMRKGRWSDMERQERGMVGLDPERKRRNKSQEIHSNG
jgi:hypothetical protein